MDTKEIQNLFASLWKSAVNVFYKDGDLSIEAKKIKETPFKLNADLPDMLSSSLSFKTSKTKDELKTAVMDVYTWYLTTRTNSCRRDWETSLKNAWKITGEDKFLYAVFQALYTSLLLEEQRAKAN